MFELKPIPLFSLLHLSLEHNSTLSQLKKKTPPNRSETRPQNRRRRALVTLARATACLLRPRPSRSP